MVTQIGRKVYNDAPGQTGEAPDVVAPQTTGIGAQAAEEPAMAGGGGKVSKAQCHYRRSIGTPNSCGVCDQYTHGEDRAAMGGCVTVEGDISAWGLCDYFKAAPNPWPPLSPQVKVQLAERHLARAQARAAGAAQGQGSAGPTY